MPKYVYHCDNCQQEFETVHGMKETCEECELCGFNGHLTRIPQLTKIIYKNDVGGKVKDAIEENKKILKQMKKDSLRRRDE